MWTSKRAILRDLSRAQGGGVQGVQGRHGRHGSCSSSLVEPDACPLRPAERPPPLCLQEETEEEFFQQCVGDGRLPDKPDLAFIQQMLDMVRDLNVTNDEVKCNDAAVISKLNPNSAEFISNAAESAAKQSSSPKHQPQPSPPTAPAKDASPLQSVPATVSAPLTKKLKKVKQRNIALESILSAMEKRDLNRDAQCNGEPMKLLKPEDLIPNVKPEDLIPNVKPEDLIPNVKPEDLIPNVKPEDLIPNVKPEDLIPNVKLEDLIPDVKPEDLIPNVMVDTELKSELVEKVNDWMSRMMTPIKSEPQLITVVLDSTNMFKKKTKKLNSKPCVDMDPCSMFRRKESQSKVSEGKGTTGQKVQAYVPTARAGQFYQKYLEKSLLMDSLNDNIWTKAEKQMKHIDEKKRLEAQRAAEAEAEALPDAESLTEGEVIAMVRAESSDSSATGADSQCAISSLSWRNVKLPFHRHELAGRCAVCDSITRYHARARAHAHAHAHAHANAQHGQQASVRSPAESETCNTLQRVPTLLDLTRNLH